MAGFAAIVAEPKSSGANANTDGSSRSGGSAPWIESNGCSRRPDLRGSRTLILSRPPLGSGNQDVRGTPAASDERA